MKKVKGSFRLKEIESKWGESTEALFYKWRWKENLTHRKIGEIIGIPRPTVTRWFKQLGVPSQDSHRITNQNLLNVGPRKTKRTKLKTKGGPRFFVNKEFFKQWTPEMAYVLGYFAADGSLYINPRGSHYIEFTSIDRKLLKKIRQMIDSNHSIGKRVAEEPNWKDRYRLQIGSKEMFGDLLKLGFTPKKSKSLKFPKIPSSYLRHFVRGDFDGDGCVDFGFYQKRGEKKLIY